MPENTIEIRLQVLEKSITTEMSLALNRGNSNRVIHLARNLEQAQRWIDQLAIVKEGVSELEIALRDGTALPPPRVPERTPTRHVEFVEPRRQAEAARSRLESDLTSHGIKTRHDGRSETIYTLPSGMKMSVMFANERSLNRWFFGTPVDEYGAFVFLCRHSSGELKRFFLPKELIQQYRKRFAHDSANRQFKFNVFSRRGRVELAISGSDPIDLTLYKENFSVLR